MLSVTRIKVSNVEEPWWSDKPVIIVGSGPSLKGFDFNQLKDLGYILAVKGAIPDLPFADAAFGIDLPWMRREKEYLSKLSMPLFLAIPEEEPHTFPFIPNATYLRRLRFEGISFNPSHVQTGGNSGFAAFNFAVLKKAKMIFLFGYDYTQDHYCPERYTHQARDHNSRYWPRWATNFSEAKAALDKAGIVVVNASMVSSITAFMKVSQDEALQYLRRIRSKRDHGV